MSCQIYVLRRTPDIFALAQKLLRVVHGHLWWTATPGGLSVGRISKGPESGWSLRAGSVRWKHRSSNVRTNIDPLGRLTVTAGRVHCFCTCCPSVPTFQNVAKQNKANTMFVTGETVGLAEWIIVDETCLVCNSFFQILLKMGEKSRRFYRVMLLLPFN